MPDLTAKGEARTAVLLSGNNLNHDFQLLRMTMIALFRIRMSKMG